MQIPTHREDLAKGFKLSFHFVENPYFTNTEITKEILISWERIFVWLGASLGAIQGGSAKISYNGGKSYGAPISRVITAISRVK